VNCKDDLKHDRREAGQGDLEVSHSGVESVGFPPAPPLRGSGRRRKDSLNRRWAYAMTPTGWGATMPARLRSKPGRRAAAPGALPGLSTLDRQVC